MFNFFKQDLYYAVFNAANCISGYEVDDGLVDFTNVKDDFGNPVKINFVTVEEIFAFIDAGPCFREVFIPDTSSIIDSTLVSIRDDELIHVFKSDYLELGKLYTWTAKNIINLINKGANITIGDYKIVRWALIYNFEVFYFLQEYICGRDENEWVYVIEKLRQEGLL